jgi:type II secretory pathway pseudopilin PulG
MNSQHGSEAGFSLIETFIAVSVLTVGALGLAGVFATGVQRTVNSPNELLATQKAASAIESVFSARDSHIATWAQLRNVDHGGIFQNGPQPLKVEGPDGVVNTSDDGDIETMVLPGPDQKIGTPDDVTRQLDGFTREITIVDLSANLRSVTVTIVYKAGAKMDSYVLTAYISSFA